MKVEQCRICESSALREVLDLGRMPLANSFIDDPEEAEVDYPLRVVWCEECGLVQLDEVVPPGELFSEYIYVSGTSDRLRRHFDELAGDVIERFDVGTEGKVLDIGSNDGTLLGRFREHGLDVLGVEPAENIVKIAESNGIETINEFFRPSVAAELAERHGKRDVVTATNVFAHTHDVDSFLEGVAQALTKEGVLVIEVPYLVDLLENTEFDTIYHEHLSYFSVLPLERLFENHDFELNRVERVDIHGGSIRLYATKRGSSHEPDCSAEELITLEKRRGLESAEVYDRFSSKVRGLKSELVDLLEELTAEGHSVAGYGAAAKGNTLLNYYDIGPEVIDFIADKNELKQGTYTPGTNIEIAPPSRIYETDPDYLLILAWNFAEEIMEQQSRFRETGGGFIIPVPDVEVV